MPWSNTIADLLQQQGQQGAETARAIANISAQSQLQRGKIIGGAVSDIGHALSSIPAQRQAAAEHQQEQQYNALKMQDLQGKVSDEDRARQNQQKALAIFQEHGDDIDGAINALYAVDPGMADTAATHRLKALQEGNTIRKQNLDARKALDESVSTVIRRPTNQGEWTLALQSLRDGKVPYADQFSKDFTEAGPQIKAFVDSTKSAHEMELEDIARNNAKSLQDYRQGQLNKAEKPPAVGTPEDYITRTYGANPTPEQVLKGRKDFRDATTRPPAAAAGASSESQNVKDTVQGMMEGTLPPLLPGRASKDYMALMGEAKRKGFDLAGAATDWLATQKHIQTMNGAQQLRLNQSINALPELLDSVDALASKWKGGRFPILNKANLALAKGGAYGQDVASVANQLDAQIADVVSDLGNVYMGGNSPTDHALVLAGKSLSAGWDEKVLHDMVGLAKKNVVIRRNSINNTGVQGASADNPYAPPPAAVTPKRVYYDAQGNPK